MGNRGRAGQQRRSRVADLLTNISPAYAGEMGIMNTRKLCLFVLLALLQTACGKSARAAVTTESAQEVTGLLSETTAPLQTDTSDNEIPWNGPRRVYQLAQNAARGQLYKLEPVNDYLLIKIGEHDENENPYHFSIAFISSNWLHSTN